MQLVSFLKSFELNMTIAKTSRGCCCEARPEIIYKDDERSSADPANSSDSSRSSSTTRTSSYVQPLHALLYTSHGDHCSQVPHEAAEKERFGLSGQDLVGGHWKAGHHARQGHSKICSSCLEVIKIFYYLCRYLLVLSACSKKKMQQKHENRKDNHNMMVAKRVPIQSYEDITNLEMEISRLLKCEDGRKPACLSSQGFWEFKNTVLHWMRNKQQSATSGSEKATSAFCYHYLPQKLMACAKLQVFENDDQLHEVCVELGWDSLNVCLEELMCARRRTEAANESDCKRKTNNLDERLDENVCKKLKT